MLCRSGLTSAFLKLHMASGGRAAQAVKVASKVVRTIMISPRIYISKKCTIPMYGASSLQQHNPEWEACVGRNRELCSPTRLLALLQAVLPLGHRDVPILVNARYERTLYVLQCSHPRQGDRGDNCNVNRANDTRGPRGEDRQHSYCLIGPFTVISGPMPCPI
jgi:hypothetical protein